MTWARKLSQIRGRGGRGLCVAALTLALMTAFAVPASAHTSFFFGLSLPLPVYSYPAPVYSYPAPAYVPYPVYAPPPYSYAPYAAYAPYPAYVGPPGWVGAHWAWRRDPWGRRARVWVPAHLR